MNKKIAVVGSINADLVTRCSRFPIPGETLIGDDFSVFPGGKGANQAVACAKMGADVFMIGCVGNDTNGRFLLDNFLEQSVDIKNVEVLSNISSGVAPIFIAENDNMIVVVPGANAKVSPQVVEKASEVLLHSNVVLLQLEIPMETVRFTAELCFKNGIPVILNPAPAQKLTRELIDYCTYITPNEIEITQIFNDDFENVLKQFPNKIIMTAGADGVYYHDGKELIHIEASKVEVVDTTGAGDTFNGALAVGLADGMLLCDAIKFASKAAACSIQKLGAQTAMPTREKIQ